MCRNPNLKPPCPLQGVAQLRQQLDEAGDALRGHLVEVLLHVAVRVGHLQPGRDRKLTRWIDNFSSPSRTQVRNLMRAVVPLLSQQFAATNRRSRMSAEQEVAVVQLLKSKGWAQKSSALISSLSDVPKKHFMHKTRFATKTQPQEVDVACGLGATVVLAMECKVTNDVTNSVKRINDVLKKSTAWQLHWGSFVKTAALLQGVIAYKDVARLLDANVEVFWSHDLATFDAWIDANVV
jgi:hypothetical protein